MRRGAITLKREAYTELELALAIEVGCVDVEGLAEFSLTRFETSEEVESWQSTVRVASFDCVANGFEFRDVAVIE